MGRSACLGQGRPHFIITMEIKKLRESFILPVEEYKIKERIESCLKQGVKIVKEGGELNVIFEKNLTPRKKEYWREYALSTYKLIVCAKPD